jgi:predicted rRNA methylase YqxC with S4 and FtsJ domains
VVALIKPQFEAGKEFVGKKGIVRDPETHQMVVEEITRFAMNTNSLPASNCGLINATTLPPFFKIS